VTGVGGIFTAQSLHVMSGSQVGDAASSEGAQARDKGGTVKGTNKGEMMHKGNGRRKQSDNPRRESSATKTDIKQSNLPEEGKRRARIIHPSTLVTQVGTGGADRVEGRMRSSILSTIVFHFV
jgi:hypothetical protein